MSEKLPKKKQKHTSKPIFRTATPYEEYNILPIDQAVHDQIVSLLVGYTSNTVSVLKPFSEHHTAKPKFKDKKRRRKRPKTQIADGDDDPSTAPESRSRQDVEQDVPSTAGSLNRTVLVGFNAVTRHLETLSRLSRPSQFQSPALETSLADSDENVKTPRHVAAVFLLRPLDDLIYSHLPLLCQTASLASPQLPGTRLVLLDSRTESQIAESLRASPRTSVIAVLDHGCNHVGEGNEIKALIAYVREHMGTVEVPWLKKAVHAQWLGIKIDTQQN